MHAWAASKGVDGVAIEAVRYRRRGGFGIFGALCCLVPVVVIALVVYLIVRSRNRKRP